MSPEAEIALCALAFTVFCAIASLIWKAADHATRQKHSEKTYESIHRRIDDLEKQLIQLDKTLAVLIDRALPPPPPSPRSIRPSLGEP